MDSAISQWKRARDSGSMGGFSRNGWVYPGDWVLRQACKQTHAWHDAGFTDLYVAVNLSPRQFREPDLVQRVQQVLADTGLDGVRLELELTESMLRTNIDNTVR